MRALSNLLRSGFWLAVCLVVLVRSLGLASEPAYAQSAQCGGYVDVLSDLSEAYHEQIVWVGDRGEAGQLVITAKADGSTWTAMLVRGGGGVPRLGRNGLESDRCRGGDLT
ncbi:MAG: hypothetical protein MUE52_04355 [Tabrizicola sp.]|jgi:hypothetical protein|nr:hypothetical protein [Tabrizicola sp.]